VSEAYEELGGTGEAQLKPGVPAPRRHAWRFLAHHDKATKHHCTRCGTTRVRISHTDRFPSTRYTTLAGAVIQGKAPPCPPT
jgi:hypothetical protein